MTEEQVVLSCRIIAAPWFVYEPGIHLSKVCRGCQVLVPEGSCPACGERASDSPDLSHDGTGGAMLSWLPAYEWLNFNRYDEVCMLEVKFYDEVDSRLASGASFSQCVGKMLIFRLGE